MSKITKEQIMLSPVRIITLNEPYASLMAFYGKQETRNRDTKVRGLVCIHSAQKPYGAKDVLEISGQSQYDRIQLSKMNYLNEGKIISIGYLTGTKFMGDYPYERDLIENRCFVKYSPNLWIWEFEDMTAIEPIPFKGSQGWSILTDEQKALINPL